MAAFDLNNLYLLKGNKPKTTSFEDLSGNLEKGMNLGSFAKSQYDKNSLQNLIAQREQEGVPYYMLGNEAAKWNLDAAQSMDKDRMGRIKFDYEMQKDEFENWRKNMARRICGRILQIANEMGMQPSQLADVLEVAYSYVVTYDPDLANQLLARSNALRGTSNRANKQSEVKDHEKEISSVMEKAADPKGDLESDPRAGRFREKLKQCAERLLQWKNVNPYSINNPEGRLIYKRMLSALIDQPNVKDLTDEQVSQLVGSVSQEDNYGNDEIEKIANEGSDVPAKSNAAASANGAEGNFGLKKIYKVSNSGSGAYVVDPNGLKALNTFANKLDVNDPDFKDKLTAARDAIAEGSVIKDNDMKTQSISPISALLDRKEKEYDAYLQELKNLGVIEPEEAFKKFKSLFGSRASMGTVIQFRNFNAFVNSYISNAPLTAMSNGLLVGTPSYKPTVAELEAAKSVHGSWNDDMRNFVRKMKVPVASSIADINSEYPALWALGQDVQKQIRAIWNSVSKGLDAEHKAQLKNLYSNLFYIDDNAWKIIEGANFPRGEEYYKQLKAMNSKSDKNGPMVNLSGVDDENESGITSAEDIEL